MSNRLLRNRVALAGLLACLLLGAIELLIIWIGGPRRLDLFQPLGALARMAALELTSAPSLLRAGSDRADFAFRVMFFGQLAVVVLFALLSWLRAKTRGARLGGVMLASQLVLALLPGSALSYVLAAEYGLLPVRRALAWMGAQAALAAAAAVLLTVLHPFGLSDDSIRMKWLYASFGILLQLLVFAMSHMLMRERRARLAMAAAHAQLLATRSLLGDTVRASERTRIARDLHDAVGHHLTALNLHLDLALRQAANAVPAALHTSRELARGLLAEVRVVVSAQRDDQHIDLRAALQTLCSGIPEPAIRLRFGESLGIVSPALAHTVFHCVQEAISNAVRHAGADLLTIDIAGGEQVTLVVADDGRGSDAHEGNGLRGMRERVAGWGGRMAAGNRAPRGFGLEIALPFERCAA